MKNLFDQILTPTVLVAVLGAIAALIRYLIVKYNERRSINRALLSEISRLLSVITRHKKWWEECMEKGNTDLPLITFSTDVYETLLKFWGEVDPSYTASATRFFGYIKFLNRLQESKSNFPAGKMNMFEAIYLDTLGSLLKNFKNKFEDAFIKFNVEMPI